jgi:FKBP12-rapamycin complex-associated protein
MGLAEKSLNSLLDTTDSVLDVVRSDRIYDAPYPVAYSTLKYVWAAKEEPLALRSLKDFCNKVSDELQMRARDISARPRDQAIGAGSGIDGRNEFVNPVIYQKPSPEQVQLAEDQKLLAKCYLKQGDWQTALSEGDWHGEHVDEILASYNAATRYNHTWYKAWHAWALANFEVVNAAITQGGASGNANR